MQCSKLLNSRQAANLQTAAEPQCAGCTDKTGVDKTRVQHMPQHSLAQSLHDACHQVHRLSRSELVPSAAKGTPAGQQADGAPQV